MNGRVGHWQAPSPRKRVAIVIWFAGSTPVSSSMSKRIIKETDCDRCGTKNVPVKCMRVETGRDLDPAGGASEAAGVCFDLCINCLAALFQQSVLQEFKTHEAAKTWVNWLKLKNHETW